MSEQDPVEVRVKLTIDQSETKKVGAGMKESLDKAKAVAEKGANDISSKAIARGTLLADIAKSVFHKLAEAAREPFEAFEQSQREIKGLASTFLAIDQNSNSFAKLTQYASDAKDELGDMAMATGETGGLLLGVFTNVIERGGRSIEKAQELTQEMAYAGRAIPGGAEALSVGFERLEQGMVNAKNPLVQLIAATGTLKGNARAVATQMQKMSIDKQTELAEKAIGKMSSKMKDVPLGLSQMKASLSNVFDSVMEGIGGPMVKKFTEGFRSIYGVFVDARGQTTQITKQLFAAADYVGGALGKTFEMIPAAVDGFKNGIVPYVDTVRQIWSETFNRGDSFHKDLLRDTKEAAEVLGEAFVGAAASIALAASALRAAADWLAVTYGTMKQTIDSAFGSKEGVAAGHEIAQKGIQGRQDVITNQLSSVGLKSGDRQALIDQFNANVRLAHGKEGLTAEATKPLEEASAKREAMLQKLAAAEEVATIARNQHTAANWETMAEAWNQASRNGDVAAQNQAARLLWNAQEMGFAMGKFGEHLEGGAEALIKILKEQGLEAAAAAVELGRKGPGLGDMKKNAPVNFTGPITIKQDFRDQDPDRIALIFREDLAKNAASRLGSNRGGFG